MLFLQGAPFFWGVPVFLFAFLPRNPPPKKISGVPLVSLGTNPKGVPIGRVVHCSVRPFCYFGLKEI